MGIATSSGHWLLIAVFGGAILGACSISSGSSSGGGKPKVDGSAGLPDGPVSGLEGGGIILPDAGQTGLALTPPSADLTVDPGAGGAETVQFTLTGAAGQDVSWRVTNPSVGYVDQNGLFTATGLGAGVCEVQAVVGQDVLKAKVTVTIQHRQNGGQATSADAGAGGLGGVGGEGLGGAISDQLVSALSGNATNDPSLKWLYPYDRTVFPLDVLPPLLQWSDGSHGTFDAVYIHLSAPPYYDYKGFFGRPALLGGGSNFVRHPIPKEVWQTATASAAGGTLTVELVLSAGGQAYGPIRESYQIALAPIHGKIYYQAYNTSLAQNYDATAVTGERLGGATLSITVGDEAPKLVAGRTTPDHSGCRVCHSVSAYGDRMIVQHGEDYMQSATIDLKNGNQETNPYGAGLMGWIGLYPDGTIGLKNSVDVGGPQQVSGGTGLYNMTTGAAIPSQGLSGFATSVGLPIFSPDGKHVSFTLFEGPSTPSVGSADGRKLVVMDFDLASKTFSNPRKLWETSASDERPSWSTFLPSSSAVVFQRRWDGTQNETFATRYGARGELYWVDLANGTASPLDQTNGIGANGQAYLPRNPSHPDDEHVNYEPSISPVASGGYAWMVFMSRRMYGSVATIDPYFSDPREHDLRADVTPKKIWMAAIDLNPQPGKDPSHPAFYIPGQELYGVNSRPFFALEPCTSDSGTCSTGVDCCSGFCRDGYCVPPPVQECSQNDEKCTSTDQCCDSSSKCIGGFCALFIQ